MNNKQQKEWRYERGEGRFKHSWKKDEAGFVGPASAPVGKCHSSIDEDMATTLLNDGIAYQAPGAETIEHIYAVYRGAIYEAAPTAAGSFHGYPWMGKQGRPALPDRIFRELRTKAEAQKCLKEFEQWLKKNS